jgi:hypothetical protein
MTTKLELAEASGRRDIMLIIIEKLRPGFIKQAVTSDYLLMALKASKNIRKQRGGDKVKQGLRLGSNTNMGWFGRGQTKAYQYQDILSECQTKWSRCYAAILSLFVDEQEASGDMAIANKWMEDLKDKNDGMIDMLDAALYGGKGYVNGPLDGLQYLIADNPCKSTLPQEQEDGTQTTTSDATVLGINQNDLSYSYWRNIALDFNGSNDYTDAYYGSLTESVTGRASGETGYIAGQLRAKPFIIDPVGDMDWDTPADWNATTGAVGKRGAENYLEDAMEWAVKTPSRGKPNRKPKLILTTKKIHSWFKKGQLQYVNIGYVNTNFGFGADVSYEGIPLVWTDYCPDGHMYFLDTDFMHLVYDPKYWFVYSKPQDLPNHIMDKGMFLIAILNLMISRRTAHTVIYNIDSWSNSAGFST